MIIEAVARLIAWYAVACAWRARREPRITGQLVWGSGGETTLYRSGAGVFRYRCVCGAESTARDPVTHVCPGCGEPTCRRVGPHHLRSEGRIAWDDGGTIPPKLRLPPDVHDLTFYNDGRSLRYRPEDNPSRRRR